LLAAGSNLSLFGDRKLIDLRIPTGKPGKDGGAALEEWCRHQSPDNLLLITLPELDWREEKAAWFTALVNAGVVIRLVAPPLAELPGWLAGRLRRQQQSADEESLRFIAERVEGNLLAAHQEIEKLSLLYPQGELSFEQIEAAVMNVARYDVFKLGEAVLAGQVGRALRMLDGLQAEGEAAVLVHWTIAEDIRALQRVKDAVALGKPLPLALREARVWGPRERLLERALPFLSQATLACLLDAASVCDGLVKGLRHPDWPVEPWQALRKLVLMLAEHTARAAKGPPLRIALMP